MVSLHVLFFMINFSCVSYNTKGLRQDLKRVKIFNFLREKVPSGIILLQETHSVDLDLEKWSNKLNCDIFLNSGASNSRGTFIAFYKDLDYNVKH